MKRFALLMVSSVLSALLLGACSGGSGGSGDGSSLPPTDNAPPPAGPTPDFASCAGSASTNESEKVTCPWALHGIEGTGRTKRRGMVQSIGTDNTVVVDGIRYSTRDASIVVNGACARIDQLGVGHVVDVIGIDDETTGTADAIFLDFDVAGPISSINEADHSFVIIGQVVRVDATTVFADSIEPGTLTPGDEVAVSGIPNSDGELSATRIQRWPSAAYAVATGVVSGLEPIEDGFQQFRLNMVRVVIVPGHVGNLDGIVTVFVGFPAVIHDGDRVRVQGDAGAGSDFTYARAIEYVDYLSSEPTVALTGPLTRWTDRGDFDVNEQPVAMGSYTVVAGVGGNTAQGVLNLHWVTAVGPLDDEGVLRAQAFVGGYPGPISLEGPVTEIDAEKRTVLIAGIPVETYSGTVLRQTDDATLRSIGFADITVGNQVQVLADAVSGRSRALAFRMVQGAASQKVCLRYLQTVIELQPPMFRLPVGDPETSVPLVMEADADTKFYRGLYQFSAPTEVSAETFWNIDPMFFRNISVIGRWTGDHVLAEQVSWLEDL